jgi:16S rRNA (cytosine967-C5)-methyltransferase
VKPGGVVVYSTCTVIRQENEGVIEGFLKTHQDFKLDDAGKYIPRELVSNGYFRVWPHQHGMDGAFGARMLKTKS